MIFSVLLEFLLKLTKLISIKNGLRIFVMGINYQLIQFELKKEILRTVNIPAYGIDYEIPILLIYFLATFANVGILETAFKIKNLFEKMSLKKQKQESLLKYPLLRFHPIQTKVLMGLKIVKELGTKSGFFAMGIFSLQQPLFV